VASGNEPWKVHGSADARSLAIRATGKILGERILNAAPALRPVARIVRSSHERWDGGGYPDGLKGAEIPRGARIVAVCDAYEAMTCDRPYRGALSHEAACEELLAMAGTQFDPEVVEACIAEVEEREAGAPGGRAAPRRAAAGRRRARAHAAHADRLAPTRSAARWLPPVSDR
jgi:response regulator RpfG family c-di-GMP phosphodiesterase